MVDYSYDPDDYRPAYDRRDDWRMEDMIDDARRELDREERRQDPVVRVINDPSIVFTAAEKKAINDPKKMITPDRRIVSARSMQGSRGDMIAGRSPLYPTLKVKRTRKKTKMDRTMSKCLKMANAKARKKNGQLKKGWSQGRIMKEAHRLCRKHG